MGQNEDDNQYPSFKIPERTQQQVELKEGVNIAMPKKEQDISLDNDAFYEIEYDSYPIKGVGKFVLKPQKIEPPQKDEIKELFYQMREIRRDHNKSFNRNPFFDRQTHFENSIIFCRQGVFMKDFSDDYIGNTPFSSYFPTYQMMGYEQLRTYFTWRTKVRNGNVTDISLSYAFVYIYELINNIGTQSPQDGLSRLMSFWKAFREYNKAIDKYIIHWLKDYHIYYNLPFNEFVEQNELFEYYPQMTNKDDDFNLFSSISKYDIRKSIFYTEKNKELVEACFNYVIEKIKDICKKANINFDKIIFTPTKKMSTWEPFKEALFYDRIKQTDRKIILSQNEIYICKNSLWQWSTNITSDGGKQLVSYVMKQMESVLRRLTGYKTKLSADIKKLTHPVIDKLNRTGLSLEKIVTDATIEFYKDFTKIVVMVDHKSLDKIREEALIIQEKLVVEEEFIPVIETEVIIEKENENLFSGLEIEALRVILSNENIKSFADKNGIMLEVLIDGINEKAMDFIGDNILDEDFIIYDDYIEKVKEIII